MMRRIDREYDLPSHIARKIKEKFKQIFSSVENLNREKEEIKQIIQGLEDSSTQIREYLDKLRTGEIPSIEDRIANLEDAVAKAKDALKQINQAISDLDSRLKKVEEELAATA